MNDARRVKRRSELESLVDNLRDDFGSVCRDWELGQVHVQWHAGQDGHHQDQMGGSLQRLHTTFGNKC